MAKRYCFWRQPTGNPSKDDFDRYAPSAHLEELGSTSKVKGDKIEWPAFQITQRENIVRLAFVVIDCDGRELNESDTWEVFRKAIIGVIRDTGGGTAIQPKRFLLKADKFAAEYFRKSKQEFLLVSSLSIACLPAQTINISGCQITSLKKRGKKYPLPSNLNLRSARERFSGHLTNTLYMTVKVKVKECSGPQKLDSPIS